MRLHSHILHIMLLGTLILHIFLLVKVFSIFLQVTLCQNIFHSFYLPSFLRLLFVKASSTPSSISTNISLSWSSIHHKLSFCITMLASTTGSFAFAKLSGKSFSSMLFLFLHHNNPNPETILLSTRIIQTETPKHLKKKHRNK